MSVCQSWWYLCYSLNFFRYEDLIKHRGGLNKVVPVHTMKAYEVKV